MSALDAALRERLRGQIKTIQRELGVTTLYVTHDQEEALAVSDRVAVMNGGHVEQVGSPRAIYREPTTPFVASFVGDNNLFEGSVTGIDSGGATVDVEGTPFRVEPDEAKLRPGATATFAVRPEQLRVVDGDGSKDSDENRLTGDVKRAEFLGETTRVWLDWEGRELVVRTPTKLDGRVTVAFDADAAHVVGDGETATERDGETTSEKDDSDEADRGDG
jgi:thiamine transport system ATP-binding protein